jgi:putative GTP pyrophosphokinase
MKERILQEFLTNKYQLDSFKDKVVTLLHDLLHQATVAIHQMDSRTKGFDSLSKKIDKKQGKYESLHDITDLVGIRIITYLESDVDKIAELIENEFILDQKNSIDKRLLKSDQFGYKSLHIVVSLSKNRSGYGRRNAISPPAQCSVRYQPF